MLLTDDEKAMLDGRHGKARQKAMDLLVRYAEALGAERFVDTNNVAGVPGSANAFLQQYYKDKGGVGEAIVRGHQAREAFAVSKAVQILKTCTPYLAGNVPAFGEHCAWMESSAVIYANSVLGARTNTEGRESTSAAMLTGKIPDWGLHRDAPRRGTHLIDVEVPVESVLDWGMLGYYTGDVVQEHIPVLAGVTARPDIVRLKHFGAAASSSGGVEMYHIAGVTPEAPDVATAFGSSTPRERFAYGAPERRRVYDALNANASDPAVDFVMLGCPHAALEQLQEAAALLDGRRISANTRLWIFTSRAVRDQADAAGYTATIQAGGGVVMTDTCSAFAQAVPPGTKVVALDSAKQAHYLPAILGVQAWFGTTRDCIEAAMTGRWRGEAPR
jgi:predicted aconitase